MLDTRHFVYIAFLNPPNNTLVKYYSNFRDRNWVSPKLNSISEIIKASKASISAQNPGKEEKKKSRDFYKIKT